MSDFKIGDLVMCYNPENCTCKLTGIVQTINEDERWVEILVTKTGMSKTLGMQIGTVGDLDKIPLINIIKITKLHKALE